jgi:hypothetical protein
MCSKLKCKCGTMPLTSYSTYSTLTIIHKPLDDTSFLKHSILELLQVSDRQDIDLISYAERNETYLSSEGLNTGAPECE